MKQVYDEIGRKGGMRGRSASSPYLFSGLLKCSECGAKRSTRPGGPGPNILPATPADSQRIEGAIDERMLAQMKPESREGGQPRLSYKAEDDFLTNATADELKSYFERSGWMDPRTAAPIGCRPIEGLFAGEIPLGRAKPIELQIVRTPNSLAFLMPVEATPTMAQLPRQAYFYVCDCGFAGWGKYLQQ